MVESIFGTDGETINIDDGTFRAANAADPFAAPNDVYAGLSTELGALVEHNEMSSVMAQLLAHGHTFHAIQSMITTHR